MACKYYIAAITLFAQEISFAQNDDIRSGEITNPEIIMHTLTIHTLRRLYHFDVILRHYNIKYIRVVQRRKI